MFVANDLIYLELQKTGGSHIRRLLSDYLEGHLSGKHNRLAREDTGKFVIGSIRNPWDWYVSLWAYGVGGEGAVRDRCARRIDPGYYHRVLPKDLGKNWLTPGELMTCVYHDAIKPVHRWRHLYGNSSDPDLFRAWLKLLLGRKNRFDMGEGYGFSPLSRSAGLLTYRYIRLYASTRSDNRIFTDRRLLDQDGIAEYDHEFNITRGMIKTESLEEDLISVIAAAGYRLTDEQVAGIRRSRSGKTNVSVRKSANYYYDQETIALVSDRDRHLIVKYNYEPPVTQSGS